LLTVSDAAPPVVTCPGCLARIERATAEAPPPRALPVIPVDAQADRDSKLAVIALWVIGALVCAGVIITAARSVGAGGSAGSLICLVIGLGGVAVLVLFLRSNRSDKLLSGEPAIAPPPLPTAQPVPGRPGVLEYNAPPRLSPAKAQAMSIAAFAGGFFAAIIVCGLGFLLLAVTVDGGSSRGRSGGTPLNAVYLAAVVVAVIATATFAGILNRRPGWRGFGPGAAVGLGLGMLALGPCAFCYLLFALQ
jgi:hypothetical protein